MLHAGQAETLDDCQRTRHLFCLRHEKPIARAELSMIESRWIPRAAVGALAGLAWAASLRGYMSELGGFASQVTWMGTFVGVLLPGVLVGATLGAATAIEPTGRGRTALRWCAASPLLFAIIPLLFPDAVVVLLTQGLGSGAAGVALAAVAGGYAVGGRRTWARIALGLLSVLALVGLAWSIPLTGSPRVAIDTARAWWAIALVTSLMLLLMIAAATPFRRLQSPLGPNTLSRLEGE